MRALRDASLFQSQALVGGRWMGAATGHTLTITNPCDGSVLGTVPDLGTAETRQAVESAKSAWPSWRAQPAKQRAAVLRRWFELIMANQEDLATLMTAEQGKPLTESRGEIAYAASFIEWFAEEAKRAYGDIIPSHLNDRRILVFKEPVGVCAAVTPWNFPAAMITRKVGPALAAGCVMVVKPAGQTPYTALALAELGQRAGLPNGVFNVITGDAATIGGELTANEDVRKISFTGSTAVGRRLLAQSAATIKKVSLELGGNAPFIVFDDADLDAAVAGAMASKYRNSGQTCVCANRILVQNGIYDSFVDRFTAAVANLRVGDGFEEGVDQGPLIDTAAVSKIETLVGEALEQGAELRLGGHRHRLGGTFFEPTIVEKVTPGMRIVKEEIFGPVSPLLRFASEEEAIAMANATEYGLAAYFYSRDVGRIWRVAEDLEYGMVGVNTGIISTENAPFGGMKQSGIGREGSKYGLEEYMEVKYVCLGGLQADD